MRSLLPLLLLAALSACPPSAESGNAQERTELAPRFLSHHQTRDGERWFGTDGDGLHRLADGRWTRFTRADGLGGDRIQGLDEDSRGRLLVTTDAGIDRFEGERFAALEIVEVTAPGEGWELDPDDLWLVFRPERSGPCRYDGERVWRLRLPESPAEAAYRAAHSNTSFSPSGVYSIHRDRRGHLWFGTAAVGVCRYDGETWAWLHEERLTTTPEGGAFGIRSIFEDGAGAFWIGNTRQRFRFEREPGIVDGFPLLDPERRPGLPEAASDTGANFEYVASMIQDEEGALWMACGSAGVWRYDGSAVTRFPVGERAFVLSLTQDRDGRLWAGTSRQGLHRLEGSRFAPFEPAAPNRR